MNESVNEPTDEASHGSGHEPGLQDRRATVTVVPKQWRFRAEVDESILDAARRAGIAFPKSCRNGSCRSCLCRLVSGSIRYRIEWPGVTREEKKDGLILPCVAFAEGDVVVEVPSARLLNAPGA